MTLGVSDHLRSCSSSRLCAAARALSPSMRFHIPWPAPSAKTTLTSSLPPLPGCGRLGGAASMGGGDWSVPPATPCAAGGGAGRKEIKRWFAPKMGSWKEDAWMQPCSGQPSPNARIALQMRFNTYEGNLERSQPRGRLTRRRRASRRSRVRTEHNLHKSEQALRSRVAPTIPSDP